MTNKQTEEVIKELRKQFTSKEIIEVLNELAKTLKLRTNVEKVEGKKEH